MSSSEAVTRGVRVHVECHYSKERSDPKNHEHFFLYTVRITNEGRETVELLNRHWVITNAHGTVQEVRGPGVVGQHPRLSQGQSFEYTSGCPLDTAFGSMHGSYEMLVTDSGERFEAEIGAFPLRQDEVFN